MSKNARSRMWSRWLSRKPAAELPGRRLGMETLEDRLAPATFTWDGGGANALWSTPANWQNDAGPSQLTYRVPAALAVNTTIPGQPGQNEVQTFLVPGEDGTFTLATNVTGTINGVPIAPSVGGRIPSNVDLPTLQSLFTAAYGGAFGGNPAIPNAVLSVSTQPNGDRLFTVQFQDQLANTNIPQLSGVYTPTIDLVFPAGALRAATQNDLVTGTVLNRITVQGQANVVGVATPYSMTQAPDPAVNSVVLGTGSPSSGTIIVGDDSGTVTYALPTTLSTNGDQSIFVGLSGSILSITAPLTGSALNNLNKDGPGQLNLTAANPNLVGGVKVNAGILQIRNTLALGPAGGTETVVGTGAGLYLNTVATNPGQTSIGEQVRLNGGGFDPTKGALYLEAGNAVWSGQVILETGITSPNQAGGPGTVIGAVGGQTLDIPGLVSDSGAGMGLVKEGPGEVKLSRQQPVTTDPGGNTYRGQTNVNNGTLTITHSLSLGDSRQTNPSAFQNPTSGTVVNVGGSSRNGQLRLEAPVGGAPIKVVGEFLVLNGAGNVGDGSFYNTRGDNTWAGSVVLGSPSPEGTNVTIGVAPASAVPSSLTVSGVVSGTFFTSPPPPPLVITGTANLRKVEGGRLIFTNANTYTGTTTVVAGSIAIRDSQGLGPAGSGGTTVNAGAAVELDIERAYPASLMPQFDDLGRDTWSDSITNDEQRLLVRETITIDGRGVGATALGTGPTAFQSTGGTGAIRSWTGINTWAGVISLASGEASIGVELDGSRPSISGTTNRPGHPLPDSSYFRDDYSLTIQDPGGVGIVGVRRTDFVKLGQGHLILPQANPYFGRTLIEQGWVTIQNNRSLGDSVPDTSRGDSVQQPTIVRAGASLHITPSAPAPVGVTTDLTILEEVIVLEGIGIGSVIGPGREEHPYSLINQKGALVNVGGNNTVVGDVGVISTGFGTLAERGAGIGVERASIVESPVGSGNFVLQRSHLTITGDLSDGITYQRSFNNTTPAGQLDGPGRRIFNVGATRGRISVPYSFGTTAQRLQIYYPDDSSPANLIYDTGDVATGGSGAVTGVGLATVNFGSLTSSGTTVVVVVTPGLAAPAPVWQVGVLNLGVDSHGVLTQFPSSFVKFGSETLVLQGAGSQSGKKNEVREGTLLVQNDTALGRATTGTEITQQTYDVTETVVASGATLQLAGSVAPHEGGVEAGLHVQDERLTLNQYGLQIRIAGQPTARFTLRFAGQETDVLQVPSGYTGAPGTYAAYLQNQINTKLTNIAATLTNGVPGASPADAAATVTELTQGVFSVTFGAARFNNLDFSLLSAFELPVNLPTIASKAEVRLSGSNAPLMGVSDDNTWRGPVTLNSGTRIEVLEDSRLVLLGDILEGAPSTAPGSDLVKLNKGDLTLGGSASTYRGTTFIDEGVVTAVSSRAFGAPSTGPYDPNLGAAPGGTEVRNRAQLQLQGSLTIAGEGLAVQGGGTPDAPSIDNSLRWLNVGPGATNNGVAPPYTGPNPGAPTTGRIDSIATDPSDPRVIYVATAGGGAWKTKDGGLTWIALFDQAVGTTNAALPLPVDASSTLLPRSAMMFSGQFAVAPSNPQVVYYATGDANGEYTGIPNSGQTDNYAGSGVYRSLDGGKTWTRLLDSDGTNPLYGQAVTKMIVDPLEATRIYVASGSVRTVPLPSVPTIPTSVLNGSTNAATRAGVWRFTPTDAWVNLTAQASAGRSTVSLNAPYDVTPPNNAGPDDDFRMRFPSGEANNPAESATWSDIQLVLRGLDPNSVPPRMQYTLYAALGESTQTYFTGATGQAIRNAVYRTDTPEMPIATPAAAGPAWWIGNGTYFPIVGVAATIKDQRGTGFPVDTIPPPAPANPPWPGRFGYIKIAAASTADEMWGGGPTPGTFFRAAYANVTLYAGALWRDPYRLDINNLPVPLDAQRGEMREFLKSVATTNVNPAGYTYVAVTAPTNPFGLASGTTYATQRPATGRYNFTLAVRDYDPRVIADNNPNELFIGGLDSLFRSVDGSTSWQTVQPDAGGFAPAEQHHAIAFDSSNRLLVGTDGGLWRWDRLRFSNLNSNLPVVQFNSVDPHPTDFRQAAGGSAGSGTQVWNGNTPDGSSGVWARVDDLSTTATAGVGTNGQTGSVSGVVRYDPFNPNTIYAVRDGVLRRSDDRGVTWPFSFAYTTTPPFPVGPSSINSFPLIVDPLTPDRIVFGGGQTPLLESTNRGAAPVSLNAPIAPTVIALAGFQGAFVADPRFPTVTEGLTNTKDPRTIYISNGTTIHVTKNRGAGGSWALTNFVLPADGTITDLVVNPVNRDEVYATVSIRNGGTGGRIWRSTDSGQTWTNLTGTFDPDGTFGTDAGPLPNIPTWKAAIDPRTGTLYVGNDNGVWVLVDAGATDPANVARTAVPGAAGAMHWRRVGDGMPNVQVRDLVLNQTNNTLTAGTYGRGMFQLFLPDYENVSGAVRAVSGQSQWDGPVVLKGDTTIGAVGTQQIQNGLSAASIDFGGTISSLDAGATPDFTLTKIGRGTVILSGANTYLGVTDVREGVLEVKNPNALGSAVGNTVVRYGAALQVRSDIELEPITINGDGIAFDGHFTGALRNVSGSNTYNGLLTLGTETSSTPPLPFDLEPNQVTIGVDSGSSLKIGQNPTGQNPLRTGHVEGATAAMGFNKELPGILILSSDNTAAPADLLTGDPARLAYLGLTRVYTGAVEVRAGQALGPVAGIAPTRVSDGAAVRIANNTDGPNAFKPTVVQAEILFLSGTGTPDGPGGVGTGALRNTGGNNTWNGPIQLTDIPNFAPTTNPAHQVAFGVNSAADVLSVGPTDGITEDFATYGQFGLIKIGPGVLALTTANQYTGLTNVNEGTVRAANDDALGVNDTSSEVQTIRVFGGGVGAAGQYRLTVNGVPTGILLSDPAGTTSTAAQVQAALEAVIAGAGPDVFVSSTPNSNGNVYTVTFRGRLAGQNVPQLGFANVAPGISLTIATAQEGGLGTVVAAGASLELDGNGLSVSETLTLNGQGVTDPSGIRYGALGNRGPNNSSNTYTGTVTFGSATSLGSQPGSDLVVTGRVLGQPNDPVPTANAITPAAAELTKVGYGTVHFPNAKEYRGRTVVADGALLISNPGSLGVGRNEVQRVRAAGAFGDTITLTLFGETTDAITLLANTGGNPTRAADELERALTAPRSGGNAPILSAADVSVTAVTTASTAAGEPDEVVYTITFTGRYANTNVPRLTDISPSTPLSTPAALVVGTNPEGQPGGPSETQTFVIPRQGGTFTLTGIGTFAFDIPLTDTTPPIAQNLQDVFDTRFGAGNTLLTETVLPGNTGRLISVSYRGTLANTNVAQIVGFFNPTLRVRIDGVEDGVGSEAQLIDVRNAVGLQYRLSYTNPITGVPVNGTRLLGATASDADFLAALTDPVLSGGLGINAGTVRVTRTTSPGGLQYLVQFSALNGGGAFANLNVLPITVTIANGGANITVTTLQDGFEGTVVNNGASLQTLNTTAAPLVLTSEWVTLNGQGRNEAQSLTVTPAAATSTYTLSYVNPLTGLPVTGSRVLTVGDNLGVIPSSSAAEFLAALTDPTSAGGLGVAAPDVLVTRVVNDLTGAVTYQVQFTGALTALDVQPLTTVGGPTFDTLEAGNGGALRVLDGVGNSVTQWGDGTIPTAPTGSPLILGSNAAIGVQSNTDVLRLLLPTTDRNQYAAPTTTLGPTNVRGPNRGFSLTKVGAGTLEFKAQGDNDYTGSTLVNDGTLLLNHGGTGSHNAVRGPLVVGDGIPATAEGMSAVVRLSAADQIADAPTVTVNADGLFDLHGFVETIGNLTISNGVVDTELPLAQLPAPPAFPTAPAGTDNGLGTADLTAGTITMTGGRLTVRNGDDLVAGNVTMNDGRIEVGTTSDARATVGTITATNTAEVVVANNARLSSGTIDLTASTLKLGTAAGSNATVVTNGASVTGRQGSTIVTGTNSVLDLRTAGGAPRGALTLLDSSLAPETTAVTGVDLFTGVVSLTNSVLDLGNGPSALLDTGGATIDVINSRLVTGSGGATVQAGAVTVTGPASTGGPAATEVDFGPNTVANLGTLTLTNADLDAGANAAVSTTGAVTLTDATADFGLDSSLTTAAGGLTLTRSRLSGTTGLSINTQAVLLADNSTLALGVGPGADLVTNGQSITVNASTLTTGASNGQVTPTVNTGGGALNATGTVGRRSVVTLGAGTISTVGPVSLTLADLSTGAGADLTAGNLLAVDSTIVTGPDAGADQSDATFGTVNLTRASLTTGTDSAFTSGVFATTGGDITLGMGSSADVIGSLTATDALVTLNDGADLEAGPLALIRSTLRLDASAAVPHTTAAVTTVALTDALIDLGTNAALSASGAVSVVGTANGSSTTGAGTLRLTGAADQTVTVLDGTADEDFTVASGLTAANGQRVVKAGAGRMTLAPTGTTLTTPLLITAGDVQVDTVTGPVQLGAAGATLSGNGQTGSIAGPTGGAIGTVSPGDGWGSDLTGILTAVGDVAFGPTSTLFLNVGGTGTSGTGTQAPGVHYDQLAVTGNVTIAAGATLTGVVDVGSIRLANRFVVLRATGTITGTFAEAAPGFVFIDGYKFNIDYVVDPTTGDNLVVLDKALIVTQTTLTSTNAFMDPAGGSPSTLNQPVTFIATVTTPTEPPGARVPPAGTTFVKFFDNVGATPVLLGRVAIDSSGRAVLANYSSLTAGTHTITATYVVDDDGVPDNDDFTESVSNPLTQIVEQPAVSITFADPVPEPISPNFPGSSSNGENDTLNLTAAVTFERSAYTPTLTVTDLGGTVVFVTTYPTVGRVHPLNTSTVLASWNGRYNVGPNAGQVVPDGDYRAVISIVDEWDTTPLTPTASTAPLTVRVDNINPLAAASANAPVINPGNPTPPSPGHTTFAGTITDTNLATWTVSVIDVLTGTPVKTFPTGTGSVVNVVWDGTNTAGTAVADGRYILRLEATDAAGNKSNVVDRTVYVIKTAPTVTLFSGLGTGVGPTTYGDAVTLTGVVALPAFVLAADANTFLSGKPVAFNFPGVTTMTSNLVFNGALNRYEAKADVLLNLPAGTYSPVTATFQATTELPAATATGSHTVNRAQLRVTAVNTNRPYAEANPDFDYVVNTADLKFGDPATVVSGEPTTPAVLGSNVGGYAITQGTVTALPNYTVAFTNGVFGVTPVPLSIQVNDATRARFGQNPAFTATYDGFKLNDGPGVVNNLNLATDAQTNSPTGTYSIFSATPPSATNYFPITVVPGTLTVTGSPNVTVVGSGGQPPQVQVLSPSGERLQNIPFDASFGGGLRTAAGDFNKDGVADYVIGSGPGRQAFVQIIDGANGATLFQAFPFEAFDGGVFVAAGDMTGDGIAELVITPDEGGGPRVVIYRGGDFSPLVSYLAIDDANFRGGVRPAVGDLDGDGFADLVVSAGFGGGPRISIWDGERLGKLEFVRMTNDFFAYEDTLRNGAFVGVGDVNGDGLGDLIAGAGPGGGPRVKIYDGKSLLSVGGNGATVFANFFAGNEANRGGVKVVAKNLDGDKFIDLVTGGGKGDRAVATAYRGSSLVTNSPAALYEYDLDGTLNGVFVG